MLARGKTQNLSKTLLAGISALALGVAQATPATADSRGLSSDRVSVALPSQPMATALISLSTQSGLSVVFADQDVEGLTAPMVQGEYDVAAVLDLLLARSDLFYHVVDQQTVRVARQVTQVGQTEEEPVDATLEPLAIPEIEEIQVVGVRASLARALDIKRSATGVVDAIVAEDISDFPDLNIGEALQRITGVTLTRNELGEDKISVRGLPPEFARVTLNGATIVSGNAGREFDFEVFASELFTSATLTKTPSADMTEGGLAATVDLRTPRAFDFDGPRVLGAVTGQHAELGRGKIDPRLSFLASSTFADGKFGALFSVAYTDTTVREDLAQAFSFNTIGQRSLNAIINDNVNNGTPLPTVIVNGQPVSDLATLQDIAANTLVSNLPRTGATAFDRERLGITAALQARPSDTFEVNLDVLYADYSSRRERHTLDGTPGFGGPGVVPVDLTIENIGGNDFITAGLFNGVSQRVESIEETYDSSFVHVTLDGRWASADNWEGKAMFAYSQAEEDELRRTYLFNNRGGFFYDLSNTFFPSFGGTDFNPLDVGDFSPDRNLFRPRFREDEEFSFKADAERLFNGDLLQRVSGGVQYRDRTKQQERFQLRPQGTVPFDTVARSFPFTEFIPFAPAGTPNDFLVTDIDLGRELILPDSLFSQAPQDFTGSFEITEQVFGGYVRSDWEFDLNGLNVKADAGVRIVHTDQTSNGFQVANGVPDAVTFESTYTNVLPSINVRFDLPNDVVARVAANRSMTRPTLTDLSPGATLQPTGLTGSQGNPELDPFIANQVDLSLEWYLAEDAVIAATAFYKDIKSFIARVSEERAIDGTNLINDAGQSVSGSVFNITTPVNGDNGSLKGIELSYQQPFTFLPSPFDGFGLSANVTFSDSKGTLNVGGQDIRSRLIGQSDLSYNLIGYYEKYGVSLRAALSHRSDFDQQLRGALPNGDPYFRTVDDRTQLDLSARYTLNENVSLSFEAINVTDKPAYTYDIDPSLNQTYLIQGAVYTFGIRVGL